MDFFKLYKKFQKDEDGAVTVDWVVLTAAIVGLGVAVLTTVGGKVESMSTNIATDLDKADKIGDPSQ
ncbi:Flp family type IVb pilin [Tranquillimonas rosea]|uniref:Flp family type IVb pilin n=1 Tax=Tranquillimonas rosea TaxID=641238 RepID=UPI003BABD5F9